jgi:hypothetical protein
LRVLGQRLAGEASDLAAQLPPELGAELLASEGLQQFDREEFYRAWLPKRAEGAANRRHISMLGR